MNGSQEDSFCHENRRENNLMLNTIEILSQEDENYLSEVLKCNVCLELPARKQVRICQEGHHFCMDCHNRMDICGICRGQLLETRNIAVEQLVSKLGALLGMSNELPVAGPLCSLSPGLYKCLHGCQKKMPAYQMLTHLRTTHSACLIDNVRSNPYSGQFSLLLDQEFVESGRWLFSAQVSDMGLFTVEMNFLNFDFFACVRLMADETVSCLFRHQLVVKVPKDECGSLLEFSVTNCQVFSYITDTETIREKDGGLKIRGADLLRYVHVGSTVSVFFSVWRKEFKSSKKSIPSVSCLPETHLFFKNDKKKRRNKTRNMRKKKLREKLKKTLENSIALSERFSRISL